MPEFDLSLLMYGLAIGIGTGLVAGLMAGLAGVGGGLIYVPVFYALMPEQSNAMATAIFASFIAIIITGFFSTRSHWRLGHVDPDTLKLVLPGLMIGAALGLWSTLHTPGNWIILALAALNAWVAYDYSRTVQFGSQHDTLLPKSSLLSGPIGFFSGFLGIGGGTMLVPLLRRHLVLRQAVGTSATCSLIMASAAIGMNLSLESDWYDALTQQWVWLLGVWLGVLLILPPSIHWAARLHDRLAEPTLRVILQCVFASLSMGLLLSGLLGL